MTWILKFKAGLQIWRNNNNNIVKWESSQLWSFGILHDYSVEQLLCYIPSLWLDMIPWERNCHHFHFWINSYFSLSLSKMHILWPKYNRKVLSLNAEDLSLSPRCITSLLCVRSWTSHLILLSETLIFLLKKWSRTNTFFTQKWICTCFWKHFVPYQVLWSH